MSASVSCLILNSRTQSFHFLSVENRYIYLEDAFNLELPALLEKQHAAIGGLGLCSISNQFITPLGSLAFEDLFYSQIGCRQPMKFVFILESIPSDSCPFSGPFCYLGGGSDAWWECPPVRGRAYFGSVGVCCGSGVQ